MKLIHAVKVFHAVKNVQVLAVKKCHAVKKVTVSGENPLMQSIVNILLVFPMQIFRDLVQACINVIPNPITSVESFMLYIVI